MRAKKEGRKNTDENWSEIGIIDGTREKTREGGGRN